MQLRKLNWAAKQLRALLNNIYKLGGTKLPVKLHQGLTLTQATDYLLWIATNRL